MKYRRLTFPLNEQLLHEISPANSDNGYDPQPTIDWLMSNNNEALCAQAIRQVWDTSDLPVRKWANRIRTTELFLTWDGWLRLRVRLDAGLVPWVEQGAPLDEQLFEAFARRTPAKLPPVFRQIATTCPGLSIGDSGYLVDEMYLRAPMANVGCWISLVEDYRHEWDKHGAVFPNAADYLVEVVQTILGDYYVLDHRHRLFFFDHEEYEFTKCGFSLEDLVATFFDVPEKVIDPGDVKKHLR